MLENIRTYISEMGSILESLPLDKINQVVEILLQAQRDNKTIFIFGNGGSSTTASHISGDLVKNTNLAIKVRSLVDSSYLVTAYANDDRYDDIFWLQMRDFIQPGDIAISITGSGKSINALKAIGNAKEIGAKTIALTGFDGGYIKDIADLSIIVKGGVIEQIEDIHLLIGHIIVLEIRRSK